VETSRHVELLAWDCLLRYCSRVEGMERFLNVAAAEHGRRNYLVHERLQRRPPVFSSDQGDGKLYFVQLADVSALVQRCFYRFTHRARMERFTQMQIQQRTRIPSSGVARHD
jgi:hypothetical protein